MSTNPTTNRSAIKPDSWQPGGNVLDRAALRLSAGLLLGGQLLYILVTQFHAGGDANDHLSDRVSASPVHGSSDFRMSPELQSAS